MYTSFAHLCSLCSTGNHKAREEKDEQKYRVGQQTKLQIESDGNSSREQVWIESDYCLWSMLHERQWLAVEEDEDVTATAAVNHLMWRRRHQQKKACASHRSEKRIASARCGGCNG